MISIGKKKEKVAIICQLHLHLSPQTHIYHFYLFWFYSFSPRTKHTICNSNSVRTQQCRLLLAHRCDVFGCRLYNTHTHTHTRLSIRFVCRARGQSYRAIRLAVHISQIDLLYGAKRILCTLSLNVL